MALIQTVHLSMANFKSAPVVPAVQNDSDRQVKMIIDDYTLTSGLTGKIAFERSDGTHYETAAELVLADNAFVADIDQALTQPGRTMVQLKVTDTLTVSSFSFVIFVEADNSGTVTPQEGIDLVTAVEAAEAAADRAESAAETLELDATLTSATKAAQAKAVGDAINDINSNINNAESYKSTDWSSGSINFSTGANSTSGTSIRTELKSIEPISSLSAASGYKFLVFGYKLVDGNYTFLGWWKNSAFNIGSGAASYYVTSLNMLALKTAGATHIRICMKNSAETNIDVDSGVNLAKYISAVKSNTDRITAAESNINTLETEVNDAKYIRITDTDSLVYNYGHRVKSSKNAYASGADKYGNITRDYIPYVYSGSTITVKSGYMMDYSIVSAYNVTPVLEGERDISGVATVKISHDGYLLLSFSDGVNDITTVEAAKALAKNALEINLLVKSVKSAISDIESEIVDVNEKIEDLSNTSELYDAQKLVAEDWHFPFIDVANGIGLGINHQIPNTATLWDVSGTVDLAQKDVWMSDGVHPFRGDGVTDMYGLTIAQQLALVSPSFHDTQVSQSAPYWTGKTFLWMGTSIPAGSDPDAGEGTGSTYPALVASYLGASVVNLAKGSSCVRANASDGVYTGFKFSHFIRSITRMIDEVDYIEDNWATIKTNILQAPSTLSESNIATMESHSYETWLLPYLDGTNTTPDLFVIDYGHNDVRPKGIDGQADLWINPTAENISSGLLAEDTYMTDNNYANLKLAFDSDLSGITDIADFAASVNRNCLQGALNFLIMVILSRKPYSRIAIVSDYN